MAWSSSNKHRHAVHGPLLDPVTTLGSAVSPPPAWWRDVDHVMELAADFALGLNALGPVDDHPVAGAAEVTGDLLGPLERRVAAHAQPMAKCGNLVGPPHSSMCAIISRLRR